MASKTLQVYITANESGLKSGLARAKKAVTQFSAHVRNVGIGVSAVLGGAFGAAQVMANKLDAIGKSAANLKLPTGKFQELKFAAERTNTSFDAVQNGMRKVEKMVGDASRGKGEAVNLFKSLGLDPAELAKMRPDEMFDKINRALAAVDDTTRRASLGAELYGKQFGTLNNFLAEYIELGKEARERGMIISDEEIKAAAAFNDAVTNIKNSIASIAFNSGFITQAAWLAKLLDDAVKTKGFKDADHSREVAGDMIYNRHDAIQKAYDQAKASGRYSDSELKDAWNEMRRYEKKVGSSGRSGYDVLDKMMKEAGFGRMARRDRQRWAYSRVDEWSGSADYMDKTKTAEERKEFAKRARAERDKRVKAEDDAAAVQKALAEAAKAEAAKAEQRKLVLADAMQQGSVEAYRAQFNNRAAIEQKQLDTTVELKQSVTAIKKSIEHMENTPANTGAANLRRGA